jgi:hypothetical protein
MADVYQSACTTAIAKICYCNKAYRRELTCLTCSKENTSTQHAKKCTAMMIRSCNDWRYITALHQASSQ